jgi:putative oxidoreductase
MQGMSEGLGIPAFLVFLVIVTEFFGSIALILGFLGRIAALGVGVIMVVAVLKIHVQYGFFMNWYGAQPGEGFEYHLLALAIVVALLIKGSGALSVDRALSGD